jgi:hypothetical protein
VQLHQDEDVLVTFKIKQRRKNVPNNKWEKMERWR